MILVRKEESFVLSVDKGTEKGRGVPFLSRVVPGKRDVSDGTLRMVGSP